MATTLWEERKLCHYQVSNKMVLAVVVKSLFYSKIIRTANNFTPLKLNLEALRPDSYLHSVLSVLRVWSPRQPCHLHCHHQREVHEDNNQHLPFQFGGGGHFNFNHW